MKKVLSFALVLALILGSFSMVFAADFPDVKNTDEYSEAVTVLTGLGVVSGYPDGTFKPDQVVTRAEMTALIINALNLPVQGKALTPFSDVPYDHWASGYIAYAVSLRIVSGYPDGTFKPDRTVSYNEALAMIINALGYTADSLVGTWPGAYVNKALGLGLLKTCRKTGDIGANRGDVVCFLYDALGCAIGMTDKDGVFNPYDPVDTFAIRHDAVKVGPFIIIGDEESFINIMPYQGAATTYTRTTDGKIIVINEVLSEFITGKLSATKLGDYKIDPALNLAGLGVHTFENSSYIGIAAADTLIGETGVWAVKISGNYVKDIYSFHEWDITGGVRKVVAAKDINEITGKTPKFAGKPFPVDDNDVIDATKFNLLGVESLDDIEAGNIAYVYLNAGGFIARIEIGTEVVEGEVTAVSSDDKNITIGGKVYKIAEGATEDGKKANKPGAKGTFYLDYNGDIFHAVYEEAAVVVTNYGFLLAIGKAPSADGLSEVGTVKLVLADGTAKVFAADKPATITDDFGGEYGAAVVGTPWLATLGPYPVSYQLNSKGEVSKLTDEAGNVVVPGADTDITKAGLYDGKIVTDDTVIINIPTAPAVAWSDAGEYTAVTRAEVLGKKAKAPLSAYLVNADDPTKIDFLIFSSDDFATVDNPIGKIIDYVKLAGGKSTVTALADGEEVTYACGLDYADLDTYRDDLWLYKFELKDGELTAAVSIAPDDDLMTGTPPASAVSGSFFIDKNTNIVYTLAADVIVYIRDADNNWRIGAVSDLDNLDEGAFVYFYDIKGTDDVYEIVELKEAP